MIISNYESFKIISKKLLLKGSSKKLLHCHSHNEIKRRSIRCDLSRVAESKRSASKSPVKRAGPSTAARHSSGTNRVPLNSATSSTTGGRSSQGNYARARVTKERECPLAPTCDSRGHLSGKLDSHFTLEACPLYHNTTPQACV